LMLVVEAEGKKIGTVEGLAKSDSLHVLQQKFLEHAALQCGICTPGFLMSAKSLLDHNPKPTESEIRYALAGNLCRCTGYDKIVRAVTDAAQTLTSGKGSKSRLGSGPSESEQTEQFLQQQEVKYMAVSANGQGCKVIGTRPMR